MEGGRGEKNIAVTAMNTTKIKPKTTTKKKSIENMRKGKQNRETNAIDRSATTTINSKKRNQRQIKYYF